MRLICLAVVLLLGLLATRPAEGQARIGILTTGDQRSAPPANFEGFVRGLREAGYVEGQNIVFEHRYSRGRPELLTDLAADLVRRKVDIIFARGPWAVPAAKAATTTIPIVGIDLESDPVERGLVKSLARPGGNITGMFLDLAELSGKQLQMLKEIIPALSRVAVLGTAEVNASQLRELVAVAPSLAVQIQQLEMKSPEDLRPAFEAARKARAKALIVLSSPLTLRSRTQIGDLALKQKLPTMFLYRAHVEAGGFIAYGPDLPDMFRRCGVYVGRILAGAKPGELPVERPVNFEMVVNLKTAKALGLTVPPSVLARANTLIE